MKFWAKGLPSNSKFIFIPYIKDDGSLTSNVVYDDDDDESWIKIESFDSRLIILALIFTHRMKMQKKLHAQYNSQNTQLLSCLPTNGTRKTNRFSTALTRDRTRAHETAIDWKSDRESNTCPRDCYRIAKRPGIEHASKRLLSNRKAIGNRTRVHETAIVMQSDRESNTRPRDCDRIAEQPRKLGPKFKSGMKNFPEFETKPGLEIDSESDRKPKSISRWFDDNTSPVSLI